MSRPRNVTNRIALGCVGGALLASGLFLVSADSAVRDRLPAWWPAPAAHTVLMDRPALDRLRVHGWWTPTVLTGLTAVLLLLLWWLAAQLGGGGGRRPIPLALPGTSLRTGALAHAMAARTERLPGVARASVRIRGGTQHFRAHISLVLDPDAEPAAVLHQVTAGALAEARESAAPRSLDATVRMRVTSHRMRRAR